MASGPRRPTMMLSTTPCAIQPNSLNTTGTASTIIARSSRHHSACADRVVVMTVGPRYERGGNARASCLRGRTGGGAACSGYEGRTLDSRPGPLGIVAELFCRLAVFFSAGPRTEIRGPRRFHLIQQFHEAREALIASRLVRRIGIRRVLTGAHETVTRAVVGHGLVQLARSFHRIGGLRNGRANARVVAGIKTVYGSCNRRDIRRARAIEDKRRRENLAVRSEGERLTPTPTKTGDRDYSVAGRNVFGPIRSRIQIGVHNSRIESGDGPHSCIHARKFTGATSLGTEAGEQIRSYHDEAFASELVGHLLGHV